MLTSRSLIKGTYVRTSALDSLINAFLSSTTTTDSAPDRQIVSLGAGTDTRYFRLRAQGRTRRLIYHEFDFPAVCAAKCRIVESKKVLTSDEVLAPADGQGSADIQRDGTLDWELLRSRENDGNVLEAGYHCHALDLRKLPTIADLGAFQGLRSDLPTLVISECCLCYLEVDVATQILKWFTDRIPSLGIVLYEPIGAYDAFGQMMVENLAARGIVMPTVQRYKTLRDQVDRLKEAGFGFGGDAAGKANAVTIEEVWDEWIEAVDKERVDGLEGLDEVEEWQMLARHYAVVWGWRGVEGWEGWRNSPHGSPR